MLRKILFFLWAIFLLLPLFLNKPTPAYAASCSAVAHSIVKSEGQSEPVPADESDKKIAILIDIDPVNSINEQVSLYVEFDGRPYPVLDGGSLARFDVVNGHVEGRPDSKGKITVQSVTKGDTVFYVNSERNKFPAGNYTVRVVPAGADSNSDPFCLSTYNIATLDSGPDNYCTTHLNPSNGYIAPGAVSVIVNFTRPLKPRDAANERRHGLILTDTRGREWRLPDKYPTDQMENPGVAIVKPLSVGTYRVQVIENYLDGPIYNLSDQGGSCFTSYFLIGTEEDPGHECTADNPCDGINITPNTPLSLPCPTGSDTYSTAKGCTKIQTAVGVVGTGAPAFTRWVLGFILSISGGIVLLIIIISGYRLMTSQGDPEKIKNARDQLTAAIVGLLFIIFSLVILQLITSDVLGLPGFGS